MLQRRRAERLRHAPAGNAARPEHRDAGETGGNRADAAPPLRVRLHALFRDVDLRAELIEMAIERRARGVYLRSEDNRVWIHSFVSFSVAAVCGGTEGT